MSVVFIDLLWVQTQNILEMFSKSLRQIQQYDPFAAPPDAQIAQRHRLASMVGEEINEQAAEVCPCCCKPIQKREYDLRCSIQDIGFLGNAIELYFKSIKIAVVMLTALALLFLAQWMAYQHLLCQQQCQNAQINLFCMRLTSTIEYQLKLCLVGVVVLVLLPLLAKRYYDIEAYLLKKEKYQPEQFTLLLEGFPKCKEDDVKVWMFKEFGVYPLEIHILYDIKEIRQVYSLKEKDIMAYNKENIKFFKGVSLMSDSFDKELLDKKKTSNSRQLKRLDSLIQQFMNSKTINQSGAIFAVFSNPQKVEQIIQKYQLSSFQKIYKALSRRKEKELKYCDRYLLRVCRNISVKPAMNPRDCMWKSFHSNHLSIKIIASIVLALFGYFLLFITAYAHKLFFSKLLWPYSFFVTFLSYALFHLLLHLSTQAYLSGCDWHSFTQRQKYSFYIYLYFNVFLVCMLPYATVLHGQDLLQMINLVVLLDALIHPVIKVFNFNNIYRKMLASYILSLQKNKNPYPQNYLNKLMEGRKFKIGQNYHFLLRALLVSCYFSHPTPLAFIYYIISLVVEYWTQKYLLLRKCRTPPKCSQQLSDSFIQLLAAMPVLYVLGVYQYTTHFYANNGQYTWYFIIMLVAAKILSLLTFLYLKARHADCRPERTYSDVQNEFTQYYQLENEINRYNGQLKNVHKSFGNRMVMGLHTPPKLEGTIEPLLDSEYKNSQVYSPQLKNTHARLVRRLLSTSIEMSRFAAIRDLEPSFEHP